MQPCWGSSTQRRARKCAGHPNCPRTWAGQFVGCVAKACPAAKGQGAEKNSLLSLGLRRRRRKSLIALTRKLLDAGATGGQLGLFDNHHRKAILDRKAQTAALANQPTLFRCQPRVT